MGAPETRGITMVNGHKFGGLSDNGRGKNSLRRFGLAVASRDAAILAPAFGLADIDSFTAIPESTRLKTIRLSQITAVRAALGDPGQNLAAFGRPPLPDQIKTRVRGGPRGGTGHD